MADIVIFPGVKIRPNPIDETVTRNARARRQQRLYVTTDLRGDLVASLSVPAVYPDALPNSPRDAAVDGEGLLPKHRREIYRRLSTEALEARLIAFGNDQANASDDRAWRAATAALADVVAVLDERRGLHG